MLFKHVFSFFFIIWVIIFMISFINVSGTIIIFKPNIWFSTIKFLFNTIFSSGKSFNIFSAIDVSSWTIMSSRLYPNFFLNSMASGNLQWSIISCVSFSIIKMPFSPLKNVLCFSFSSPVVSFVFFPLYFLILFKATLAIFECPSFVFRCHSFFARIQLYPFFIVILYCFNTTFFPCFFCNI